MGATVITTSTSCESEGCTDPNAENFDADADNDDGTCILAREKFLGTYDLTENCSTGADSYTLTITASSTSDENIVIANFYAFSTITASVNGETFTFDQTEDTINYSGTGTISGNTVTINYTASLNGQEDICSAICIKQ